MKAVIIGTVARAGVLTATTGGTELLENIAIKIERKVGEKIKVSYVSAKIFGKSAKYFSEKLVPQVNVLVEGLIEVEKNQKGAPNPFLTMNDVQILPMALPQKIKIFGCGNVTREATTHSIKDGQTYVLNTSIACNRKVGNVEKPSFFEISYFANTRDNGQNAAVNVAPYIGPKSILEIDGFLDVEKYKNNQQEDRQKVVITVDGLNIVKGNGNNGQDNNGNNQYSQAPSNSIPQQEIPEIDLDEEEIPF